MKRLIGLLALLAAFLLATAACASQHNTAAASSAAPAAAAPMAPGMNYLSDGEYERAVSEEISMDMAAAPEAQLAEMPTGDVMPSTGGGVMPVVPVEPPGGVGGNLAPEQAQRKVIYTADVRMQTKAFDEGIALIEEMTTRYGGFMQSSNVQGNNAYGKGAEAGGRYANYTLRIPETGMRTFLNELEGHFNISGTQLYSDDVTGQYYDIEARLASLRTQERQLLAMLEQAAEVEYLIEVQRELSRVNYEIESYTTSLNRMKDLVAYSTVNLSIEEVVEYEPPVTLQTPFTVQISNTLAAAWKGFAEFWRDALLALVALTPALIVLVPILAAVFVLLWLRRKRRKNRLRAGQEALAAARGIAQPPQTPKNEED